MKKMILNLSDGGCISIFTRSIVKLLKFNSSSGKSLRASHDGVSFTGSVELFRPIQQKNEQFKQILVTKIKNIYIKFHISTSFYKQIE